MSKRDVFRIVIKLFGLYSIVLLITALPQVFSSIFLWGESTIIIGTLLSIIIFLSLIYIMLVKTDKIISVLKLDKDFDDEKASLSQFTPTGIIKLGLVIVSAYLIILNLPDLVTNLFYLFKYSIPDDGIDSFLNSFSPTNPNYYVLISSAIQIVVCFFVLTNKNRIAERIEKLNK